jgi:transcription elongation factor GreA
MNRKKENMTKSFDWDSGLLLTVPSFPKITTEYQLLLDAGDFTKIEDLLMERLDTAPQEIPFYLPAYRAFVKKQDINRASALLGLHVESLKARHDFASEISLLQAMLGFWQDCEFARDLLVRHLQTMYSDSPNFERYAQHLQMNNGAGIEKLRHLELWLRYDEGRVIYMPAKGVARVKEANPKIGVIRIVFKNKEQLTLRIDEAQRLAQPLPAGHFLARTMTDIDGLTRLAADDPGELLRLLFTSIKREAALNELREMLSGIVPDPEWSSWWARSRKDPRLIVGSGTKPKLNWNDSVSDGNASLVATFKQASPYDKLEMLKKHAARSEALASEMARILLRDSTDALATDPALALEIALTLEESGQKSASEKPAVVGDVLTRSDAGAIIAGIKDRPIRKKALQSVTQYRDDWPDIYCTLLKTETDTSLFKLIYESLHDKGQDDLLIPEIEHAFSDPASVPRFYLWLCKELSGRPELLARANWDFLRSLLGVLDHPEFKGHYPALRKLFDPGEAVDRAIETLDASTGRSLLDALSRDRELEDYRKESVRQKLFQHFPELRENMRQHLLVTKEALEKKRLEFEKLIKEDIPHNTREIQRTREFGDLRENFEYHAARRKQELLSSRAKTMHDELVAARAIEPATVDVSKISIGTRFCLKPESGPAEPVTLTILGPWDSDPTNNVLSYTSAAAEALLNAPKGSKVTFNQASYVVDDIVVWAS